ncbi:metallophosphoesterase family protein [Cellulosimicrobium cellulans]|uniref:metallophosphoesterase family protein n=1 Tax=Cellulosimicrobium cellulans TaxID=1710 RepID=UPI0008496DF4|nr:metallophosphoesterase [Cellulosimicrobium cellulans]
MTSPHRTPPRWVRWTLGVLAALVPCVVWGVTTATAERSLGPHEARYEVSTDGVVVVDLGPLGTLQIDSPLPLDLGVDVTVQEIPADLTAVGQAESLAGLEQDLEDYLRFFGGPQETIGAVARALVIDALRRTGFAILVVGAAGVGLYALLGAARRRELARAVAPRTYEITASVVLVALVGASLSASNPAATGPSRPASAVFAGTPLEGARITGRLSGIVDTYGGMLVDLYRENEDFYARADDNLVEAWERRATIQRLTAPRTTGAGSAAPASATPGSGEVSDGETDEPTDEASRDPADEAGERTGEPTEDPVTPEPAAEEDLVTLLLISDLHCNIGMAPLIRTVAERSDADVVLNAGDTTMNGTAVESYCVDAFAGAVPNDVPVVVADGNHDSVETSAQERANGQTVLDGEVVEVEGIRILGDRDPLDSRLGDLGPKPPREETPEEYAARMAETACADPEGVDLLLIHTPRVGNEAIESGCVPAQISGHMHTRSGPERLGQGVRYVSGSTAGAVKDELRIGPLKGTAEMTVLRFDPQQRRIVDWQLVQVGTDMSATVRPRLPWPAPAPPSAAGTPAAPGAPTGPDAPTTPGTGDETESPAGNG